MCVALALSIAATVLGGMSLARPSRPSPCPDCRPAAGSAGGGAMNKTVEAEDARISALEREVAALSARLKTLGDASR